MSIRKENDEGAVVLLDDQVQVAASWLRTNPTASPEATEAPEHLRTEAPQYLPAPKWRRVLISVAVFLGLLIICCGGGILNRIRGGLVNLNSIGYWPAHACSRLIFALPTGIVAGLLSRRLSVFFIVTSATWCTLFVGWGCYFGIGQNPDNYRSRSGVFDWLIGRQEENWTYSRRVLREYAGMSLRGLVWTAPQGYALCHLGQGCSYALSGSLMAFVYFCANHASIPGFCSGIACSEYTWGYVTWFILLTSLAAACFKNPQPSTSSTNQGHTLLAQENLYQHPAFKISFEIIHYILTAFFSASVVFYSLVVQVDLANKGQTFFGMQMAFLVLLVTQVVVHTKWLVLHREKTLSRQSPANNGSTGEAWTLPVNRNTDSTLTGDDSQINYGRNTLYAILPCSNWNCIQRLDHESYLAVLFSWMEVVLVFIGFLSILVTAVITVYDTVLNIHIPRLIDCRAVCQY